MRYLYFEILVISNSVPRASNLMKWSRFKLKTFVNPSNKYLSNWEELAFFCTFHEQSSLVSTRGIHYPPSYGYRRSFQFSQIFQNKEANLGEKLYHVSKFTIQNLWLNFEVSHFSVDVLPFTRPWKKIALKYRCQEVSGANRMCTIMKDIM